ncbi:MAG: hypothetical protein HY282_05715 [Nitrospirae bacterium]|nr:hypothetical protein [Candidatus Manganitrophaceae bacterium]
MPISKSIKIKWNDCDSVRIDREDKKRTGAQIKRTGITFSIAALVLFSSSAAQASARIYVGLSVGTAVVVGGGIASFNVGYSQRVDRNDPAPGTNNVAAPDLPAAMRNLSGKVEVSPPVPTLPDLKREAQSAAPAPFRFELPFFLFHW